MVKERVLIIAERSNVPVYLGNCVFLGALYIISFLESKGIKIDFFDRNAEYNRQIDYRDYDIIGFTVNVNNIERSLKTAYMIKSIKPKTKVVFGGPLASACPEILLNNQYIDVVFVGESEESFYEYVSGVDLNGIKGLYFREDGKIKFTGTREWIEDLDSLPFPAINRLNIKKYNQLFARSFPVSNIVTSRGCPYQCSFCYHNLGYKWRARSPKNVVDEIEWQVNSLGVREIIFQDDNLTFDLQRAKEIFDEILNRKIKVSLQITNGLRMDRIDRELLEKMHAAGVWTISLAPETGSHDTFKRLNKGFKLEDTERILCMMKEVGIATEIFLIVGFPWETKEDLRKTTEFAFKLNPDFATVSRFISFPKTPLYNHENSLNDKSYQGKKEIDGIDKFLISFFRRYYLRPKKLFRIVVICRFYSLIKILNPSMLRFFISHFLRKLLLINMEFDFPQEGKNNKKYLV